MRRKRDTQALLDFQTSNLQLTNEHYARYEAISRILDETPRLLELVHRDLEAALENENRECRKRGGFVYTSEMVLRLSLCQFIEGASLREIVVRVDDSHNMRRFARINDGPMMNYTTLCKLKNAVDVETWKEMNRVLAKAAVKSGRITGDDLRLDTTAVETNVHWPTDSSLLWDGYRTLAGLIERAREIDAAAVGKGRIHLACVKRTATKIARKAQHKGRKAKDLKALYKRLIASVEGMCDWASEVADRIAMRQQSCHSGLDGYDESLLQDLRHFETLTRRVIWQARERVFHDRPVPNDEKLFSIFEPHTELLKRGKAGKDIEFGHMIQIQQTGEKFITDYDIFEKKPNEPALLRPALEAHKALFGTYPNSLAGDGGYWSADEFEKIQELVEVVAIPKKGRKNQDEQEREHSPLFRLAQAFRAGVEGTISFFKRYLRLARCMSKGWEHYAATIGATVFAHNLLALVRC